MKDIKSILIGVFATISLFLFIGATTSNANDNNRYEWIPDNVGGEAGYTNFGRLLDKKTGAFWKLSSFDNKSFGNNRDYHWLKFDLASDNPSIIGVFESGQEALDKHIEKKKKK